jgi:hypothetical protein
MTVRSFRIASVRRAIWAFAALAAVAALVLAAQVRAAPLKAITPTLTVSVIDVSSTGYTFHVVGTNYGDTQTGGQLEITCASRPREICLIPDPSSWIGGETDNGSFFVDFPVACGSNAKFAQAVDFAGTESKRAKAPC